MWKKAIKREISLLQLDRNNHFQSNRRDKTENSEYKKFGPGTLLRAELIKYFIDHDKIIEIDQGPGDESYKANWTSKKRDRKGIEVFNNSLKALFLKLLMTKILPFINSINILSSFKSKVSLFLNKTL